ncbi:hypothetical protein M3J09_013145 [Ascochyta lentis]
MRHQRADVVQQPSIPPSSATKKDIRGG